MSGINSLSGLNNVNVDFRPTVSFAEQKKADANQPQQAQDVALGNAQPAKATSVVRQLDVLLLGAAKKLHSQGKVYGDAQWKNPEILSKMPEMKSKESIKQSDGKTLVEVDRNKGVFVGQYFQNTCPSYYKRDNFDKMF